MRLRPSAVATILIGTVLGQGTVIAVSPLLTRAYTATDFGTLAIVTAIGSVLGAGATAGTDRALPVAHDDGSARSLVLIGVACTGCWGLVTTIVSWAASGAMADRFAAPALATLWWLVPVTTVVIALQRIATAQLARRRRHRAIAVRNACQGLGQTAWNLALAPLGPIGLVGGLAAGRTAALAGVVRIRRRPARAALAGVRPTLARYRRFVFVTPWSSICNVVGQQAPSILIAAMHGSAAAGFVALTMRVLGSPVGMLADAVAQVAAGSFGQQVLEQRPVRGPLVRTVSRLLVGGIVAAICVVLTGPWVFSTVFGSEWSQAGTYARVLAPAFALQLAVSPVSQVLAMLGRQTTQLVWDGSRLVATTAAVAVPSMLGASLTVVLCALAAAMVASYLTMLGLVLRATRDTSAAD